MLSKILYVAAFFLITFGFASPSRADNPLLPQMRVVPGPTGVSFEIRPVTSIACSQYTLEIAQSGLNEDLAGVLSWTTTKFEANCSVFLPLQKLQDSVGWLAQRKLAYYHLRDAGGTAYGGVIGPDWAALTAGQDAIYLRIGSLLGRSPYFDAVVANHTQRDAALLARDRDAEKQKCEKIAYNMPAGLVPKSRQDIPNACARYWMRGGVDHEKCVSNLDHCWDILSGQ